MERVFAEQGEVAVREYRLGDQDRDYRPARASSFFNFPERVYFTDLGINYTEDNALSPAGKIRGYLQKKRLHRKRLSALLMAEKADVVVSLFPSESSFIPDIKDGSRKVLELHFNRYFRLQYGRKGIIGLIDRMRTATDRRLVSRFDDFVVLTQEDREAWGDLGNIHVIPNAVTTVPDGCSALDGKRVVAVGRLDYQKGFDRLIDAWAMMLRKHPELSDRRLDIFGQGEWLVMLTEKIKASGLEGCVEIHRPTDNITAEYLDSSSLVMSSNYEGFGMVLVEAMACGVPCVSFDCPCGPKDIIEDGANGSLVRNGDIAGLAEAMARVLGDDALRAEMGAQARRITEKFSESAVMEKWMRLFSDNKRYLAIHT